MQEIQLTMLQKENHSLNHTTRLKMQDLNCYMNLFSILSYESNLLRKGMMQITQKMQGPKCLFHGRDISFHVLMNMF